MTSRRQFLLASAFGAFAQSAFAQLKRPRIGMIASRPLEESVYTLHIVRRLEQLGYRRDVGMVLEYRYTSGGTQANAKLVSELADLKLDLIINVGTVAAARALREAQIKAPIVFLSVNYDPVRAGVVQSLRRPAGNATGVYMQQESIAPKRMDVLREVVPNARRFAVLSDQNTREQLESVKAAAASSGFSLTVSEFDKPPYNMARALDQAKGAGADGLMALGSPALAERWGDIVVLLKKHQLPGIGATGAAEAGFLLSYGADNVKAAMRTADMAVRVLRGASPAETPVEQADEFELIINVHTAKALGINLPNSVLARATRVIQ